jgi:hypothetical protein
MYVYLEMLDVFKDACNIADINSKFSKSFAEKVLKVRHDMYHFYLTDNQEKRLTVSVVLSCISTKTSRVRKLKRYY